uniref:Putative virion glycoprotein N-terminal domain-containing protein n=1 Tax=Xiangshan tombus-like virus TaxID=2886240 RepID=A0A8K1YQR0_9TOMB|nr:MAG: hypothetical protein [Xiangshan tombus-like virus]
MDHGSKNEKNTRETSTSCVWRTSQQFCPHNIKHNLHYTDHWLSNRIREEDRIDCSTSQNIDQVAHDSDRRMGEIQPNKSSRHHVLGNNSDSRSTVSNCNEYGDFDLRRSVCITGPRNSNPGRVHRTRTTISLGGAYTFHQDTRQYISTVHLLICIWVMGYHTLGIIASQVKPHGDMPFSRRHEMEIHHSTTETQLCSTKTNTTFYMSEMIVSSTPIDTTQCIQVVTTGALSNTKCTLPTYCGSIVYSTIQSTWWGKRVGVCIGMGQKPITLRTGTKVQVPKGWNMLTKKSTSGRRTPKSGTITMELLWHPVTGWKSVHADHLNAYPMLNLTSRDFVVPHLQTIQGKHCIIQARGSECPIMARVKNPNKAEVWEQGTENTGFEGSISLGHYRCWSGSTGLVENDMTQNLVCLATYSTTSFWGSFADGIASVASEVFITVIMAVSDLAKYLIIEAAWAITIVIDIPTFAVALILSRKLYNDLYQNVIIALIISIILKRYIT